MYITMYQINKPKMVRFLKFKFLIIIKLNFNGDRFYEKILNFVSNKTYFGGRIGGWKDGKESRERIS